MIRNWLVLDANEEIVDRFEGPQSHSEAVVAFLNAPYGQLRFRSGVYFKEVGTGRITRIENGPLDTIRDDAWRVLDMYPEQASVLRSRLMNGKFEGVEIGEEGDALDLNGTIAKEIGTTWKEIYDKLLIDADGGREESPAERWFSVIAEGDTPKNSLWSRMAVKWIDEWVESKKGC